MNKKIQNKRDCFLKDSSKTYVYFLKKNIAELPKKKKISSLEDLPFRKQTKGNLSKGLLSVSVTKKPQVIYSLKPSPIKNTLELKTLLQIYNLKDDKRSEVKNNHHAPTINTPLAQP